jgi:hypothetical protein
MTTPAPLLIQQLCRSKASSRFKSDSTNLARSLAATFFVNLLLRVRWYTLHKANSSNDTYSSLSWVPSLKYNIPICEEHGLFLLVEMTFYGSFEKGRWALLNVLLVVSFFESKTWKSKAPDTRRLRGSCKTLDKGIIVVWCGMLPSSLAFRGPSKLSWLFFVKDSWRQMGTRRTDAKWMRRSREVNDRIRKHKRKTCNMATQKVRIHRYFHEIPSLIIPIITRVVHTYTPVQFVFGA